MTIPERPQQHDRGSPTQPDLYAALAEVQRQLEHADENESPIERAAQRDFLLELHDWLQAEIELSDSQRKPR